MEEKQIHDELAAIRGLMERSSKFISLSGLSGILAGVYSLVAAVIAYLIIKNNPIDARQRFFDALTNVHHIVASLALIAAIVLLLSITTAIILSRNKAKRKGQSIWGKTSRELFFYMTVPLVTGGIVIALLVYYQNIAFIVPAMLVFYGLSLVSASNFTFADIRYFGLMEIALGLIAAYLPGYGLLFWSIGFGVLHIIYGSMMYLKYDR